MAAAKPEILEYKIAIDSCCTIKNHTSNRVMLPLKMNRMFMHFQSGLKLEPTVMSAALGWMSANSRRQPGQLRPSNRRFMQLPLRKHSRINNATYIQLAWSKDKQEQEIHLLLGTLLIILVHLTVGVVPQLRAAYLLRLKLCMPLSV
jgi:hypothetical protein